MSTLISNPIMWADVPDPDIIRSGHYFYMVSTTMHMTPGCPVMRSKDLQHWEIVNYVYTIYADEPKHNLLDGQNIYGNGSWAACLREHEGIFYVCFSCNDVQQFYVYSTSNIETGPWECAIIPELFHDPSLLFDKGSVYVIYGNGDIYIKELTTNVKEVKAGGLHQLLLQGKSEHMGLRIEGCHAYYIDGYYYFFFIEWPSDGHKRRRQLCYRSVQLLGPFEMKIILDDHLLHRNNGVAQGGVVQAVDGEWFSLLFQDREAVGRIPVVMPMSWVEGWPVLGEQGSVPFSFATNLPCTPTASLVISDEFDYSENQLLLQWQWNHNPDESLWSVTNSLGKLQLRTGQIADTVLQARNTLTQRTEGPLCEVVTSINISQLRVGDHAGLIALQRNFGTVGIIVDEQGKSIVAMTIHDGEGKEKIVRSDPYMNKEIELKIRFDYNDSIDLAYFYYRTGKHSDWVVLGEPMQMHYTLDHFMGYRFGLYCYASQVAGGYAEFDYVHYFKQIDGKLVKITQ